MTIHPPVFWRYSRNILKCILPHIVTSLKGDEGAAGRELTSERKPRSRTRYLLAALVIAAVVIGVLLWQTFPFSMNSQENNSLVSLPHMNLTLIGLNDTQRVLNEKDIGGLPAFTSMGGFETSIGSLGGSGNYTGVQVSTLLALVGGMNIDCSLNVSASDGYSIVFTYEQVKGENYTTYNSTTGNEVSTNQPFTVILAYYENGVNLTSDVGPLRLAIVGPQGLLTDGRFWVKWVTKLEIIAAVAD